MTISEYIMESDISTATCGDIREAQLVAEMNVLHAMIESCDKQLMIMESNVTTNFNEFSIFQEADETVADAGDDKDGKAANIKKAIGDKKSKVGTFVKTQWRKFVAWLKSILTKVKSIFNKLSPDELIKMIDKCDNEHFMYVMPEDEYAALKYVVNSIEVYHIIINNIQTGNITVAEQDKINDYHDICEERKKCLKNKIAGENSTGTRKLNKDELIDFLEKLRDADMPKKVDQVISSINKIGELSEAGMETYKKLESDINDIVNGYNNDVSAVIRMQNKIVKKCYKQSKKSAKRGAKVTTESFVDDDFDSIFEEPFFIKYMDGRNGQDKLLKTMGKVLKRVARKSGETLPIKMSINSARDDTLGYGIHNYNFNIVTSTRKYTDRTCVDTACSIKTIKDLITIDNLRSYVDSSILDRLTIED